MKLGIPISFTVVALVFTALAVASAKSFLSSDAGTPLTHKAAPAPKEKPPSPVVQAPPSDTSKGDRLFRKSEPAKLAAVPVPELLVEGIAPGDLLNIRARPSPGASVVARIDNGTLVKKLGCQENDGNRWCLVEVPGGEHRTGWAAGRYLTEAGDQPSDY